MVTGVCAMLLWGKSDCDTGQSICIPRTNYHIRSVSLKAFRTGQVDLPFSDKGTKLALFSSD